jgi:uncharacterized protein (TIGR02646 family)
MWLKNVRVENIKCFEDIELIFTQNQTVLQRYADNWLINLQLTLTELQQLENDPQATEQAKKQAKTTVKNSQKKYNHPEVKTALVQMFHGKCAYCESQITVVSYGNIEHFYPKGKFSDKTFDWENLLLSCDICNNPRHKGDRFPIDPNGQPLLIDPTDVVTDPTRHLRFDWDAKARLASIYGLDERGKEVERTFDLNGIKGRKALIRARSEYVEKLFILLKATPRK